MRTALFPWDSGSDAISQSAQYHAPSGISLSILSRGDFNGRESAQLPQWGDNSLGGKRGGKSMQHQLPAARLILCLNFLPNFA
ncbi:hypothetical protein BaRGS_00021163, partial [Batillaria attramentaria]